MRLLQWAALRRDREQFRYPILCRTQFSQSDFGSSDIRLSQISLITDIGLSAHLCSYVYPLKIPKSRETVPLKSEPLCST